MLHVFSTNQVKFVARKPETTLKPGQREYPGCLLMFFYLYCFGSVIDVVII
jgi:hypothetical protein